MYIPIGSMYGVFTYIWLKLMVNVGKYTIHGSSGIVGYVSCPFSVAIFVVPSTATSLGYTCGHGSGGALPFSTWSSDNFTLLSCYLVAFFFTRPGLNCDTPLKFNSSPLKNAGWKISFLLRWLIFRGYVKLPGSIQYTVK